jgi:eukaryotic-like serine/threonine-protein kinase
MLYSFHDFDFDAQRLELRRAGTPLKADALVLRLLRAFVQRPGQLVSKRELIDEVWDGRLLSESVITVTMVRLRKTLGQRAGERAFIANVHGRGYRFVQAVVEHAARPSAASPHVRARSAAPPFVGRAAGLEQLRLALDETRAGRGSVCLVTGEAGIGKTRLIEELALTVESTSSSRADARASTEFEVVWANCQAALHTPPLWPFIQLLRTLLERSRLSAESHLAPGLLAEIETLLPELKEAPSATKEPVSLGPSALFDAPAKHRTFDAIARVLSELAGHKPCLLVIDDLHWADAASLELLRFWVERCPRARVVMLGAARDFALGNEAGKPLAEVLGHRNCHRIALKPLGEQDVHAYVGALLPDPEGAFARAVLDKSEGNPFFMVELTRALRETELPDLSSLRVPDAALALLRQRVRALDESARGVLSAAAVIGRSFELGLLSALMEQEPSAIMTRLDAALASAVIAPLGERKTAFAFCHELLKDVLDEGLAPEARRALSARVAGLLEQRSEAGASQPASLLAHHYYRALPDGDARKAVQYCTQAATLAIRGYAYADAVRAFGQAREALSLVPKGSARLDLFLLSSQTLCARVCRSLEFERLVQELIKLAHEQKAGEALAQATLLLGPHPGFSSAPGSGEALRQALPILSDAQEPLRAALSARLATLGPLAFDKVESRAQIERAVTLARSSGMLLAQHTSWTARLYARGGPDHAREAEEAMQEIEGLCRDNPQLLTVPPVLLDLQRAIRAFQDGELSQCGAFIERAEERARIIDSQELLWHAQRFRALLRFNRGDNQETAATLESLHQRAQRDAIVGATLLSVHDRVVVLGQGNGLSPRERASLRSEADDPPVRWALKLRVLARAGLCEEALRALGRVAPPDLARLPCDRDYLGTLGSLTRAVVELSPFCPRATMRAYAEALSALFARYPRHFAVHSSFLCEGSVSQLMGSLLQLLDRRREALRLFELATRQSEQAGLVHSASEARLLGTICREAAH